MTARVAPTRPATETPLRRRRGRRHSSFDASRRRLFVPFVYPALVTYTLVMIVPTAFTVWVSLHRWSGAGAMHWVGGHNYRSMFLDPTFRTAFLNTLWIVIGVGIAVFAVAFFLTMILHDMAGRKWARTVIFFPSLVPAIAISILWGYLFNPDGLVNLLLAKVGVHSHPSWLSQDDMFRTILLGMVWLSTGIYTIIFLAAVDRIPPELYDAAAIDGVTPRQRFIYITLPMMADVVSVCAVLWCVAALKTFEFLLTFGASAARGQNLPPKNVWNFSMYSYAEAFAPQGTANYGIASAAGVVVLIFTGFLAVLARRITRRDTGPTY